MKRHGIIITWCLVLLTLGACSIIDEGECRSEYILYQYRNNVGQDATDQIYKMTDFIFSKDSVLYRVDDNIMNGKMRKRPINLQDGQWIIVTYGNLNGGSRVSYTLGQTKLSEMSARVVSQSTYQGTYATYSVNNGLRLGNSDKLYLGKADVTVKGGYTDKLQTVEMSNVHIRIGFTVIWADVTKAPTRAEGNNLHARLDYVPVEHSFIHDEKYDNLYKIPYWTPRITNEVASLLTPLMGGSETPDRLYFEVYGLRWETGQAPVLKLYDGESPLITKDLDLNKYFNDQKIDLTNTRVQFFQLQIEVRDNVITISPFGIEPWEDGGAIGGNQKK